MGIPLYLALSSLPWPFYLVATIILALLAVYVAGEAERIFAEKDSQKIVIDEIVGLQFSMFLVSPTVPHVIAGFFLFRLFDIFKTFPARIFERFSGGVGIVADDIVAGIYANIVLLLSVEFLHL